MRSLRVVSAVAGLLLGVGGQTFAQTASLNLLPAELSIELNQPFLQSAAPTVTAMTAQDWLVHVERAPGGILLTGTRAGQGMIFVADGTSIKVVSVTVLDSKLQTERDQNAAQQTEHEMTIGTYGFVQRGSVILSQFADSSGGRLLEEQLQLVGSGSQGSYSLSVTRTGDSGVNQLVSPSLQIDTTPANVVSAHLFFGNGAPQTEFQPVPHPERSLEGSVVLGPGEIDVGARASVLGVLSFFDPEAFRARALVPLGISGLRLVVGAITAPDSAEHERLPFTGLLYQSKDFDASADIGAAIGKGGAVHWIGAARTRIATHGCSILGSYTTGLEGDTALDAYVQGVSNAFSTQVSCQTKLFSFVLGARRGDETLLADPRATLLLAGANYHGDQLTLDGSVVWNPKGEPDLRDLARLLAVWRREFDRVELSAFLTRPFGPTTSSEAARYVRKLGIVDAGITLSASYNATSAVVAQATIDAVLNLGKGTVSVSAGSWVDPAQRRTGAPVVQARASWHPMPALGLTAVASGDPLTGADWTAQGILEYAFGDQLPRDPLLALLRRHTVNARAFEDRNGNGIWDPGEPPLRGIEICIEHENCGPTDANGDWSATGIPEGGRWVAARAVQGSVPTRAVTEKVTVGGFRAPEVVFAFRFQGRIVVRAFLDQNGNGVRDPGEPFYYAVDAHVIGPGLDEQFSLAESDGADFVQPGHYHVELDRLGLPVGFAAPQGSREIDLTDYRRTEVDLPIQVQRSVSGRICIDENSNGRCDEGELPVGLVHVQAGTQQVRADRCGRFLFPLVPPGLTEFRIAADDRPGGAVLSKSVRVKLDTGPKSVAGLDLPLQIKLPDRASIRAAKEGDGRKRTLNWPDSGDSLAEERGGALVRTATRSEALHALRPLLRKRDTALFVVAYRDDKDKPAFDAEALASSIAQELGVGKQRVVIEVRASCGAPALDLRVYRRLGPATHPPSSGDS